MHYENRNIIKIFLKALLGIEEDLLLKAKDNVVGRTFQDLRLKVRKRASKQIQNFLFASNRCTLYSNKEEALNIYRKMKNDIRKI